MPTSSPTISFLLPVYNAASHLAETIDSLLSQTFTDFEIVIVDDGSTDDSEKIIRGYQDERIRLFKNDQNRGLIYTLNRLIDLARGEYLARMDADDIATPNRLEVQLGFLKANGADLCGAAQELFGEGMPSKYLSFPSRDADNKLMLLFTACLPHSLAFGRAELFRALKYDVTALHAEDYDLWARAALSGAVIVSAPDMLLRYRIHPGQITQNHRVAQLASAKRVSDMFSKGYLTPDEYKRSQALGFGVDERYSVADVKKLIDLFFEIGTRSDASGPVIMKWLMWLARKSEQMNLSILASLNLCRKKLGMAPDKEFFKMSVLCTLHLSKSSRLYRIATSNH